MTRPPPLPGIRHFLAVAETLNFRRAAERLGVAQPALSRSVRRLEGQLGFDLFERSKRRVALTPAGEILFREGAEAMQRLSQACARARSIAEGLSGSVMIGYSTFAGTGPMSDIIIEFRKGHPEAKVSLRLLASPEQADAFGRGALDLGFILANACPPSLGRVVISRERLVALAPASHPWAARGSLPLAELAGAPLVIGTADRWRGFRSLLDGMFAQRGLCMEVAEEADDLPVLLQLVNSGFGCTILDASFVPTLPRGFRGLEVEAASGTRDGAVGWGENSLAPPPRRFVDLARRMAPAASPAGRGEGRPHSPSPRTGRRPGAN